ncbi:MAG TPA: 23S rRNA (pseudouridine(1915)-N(3))-methyltransferase RlmH, partial [Chitinophagaceae bacterium]|nr:23S rRNA (pseudouridine(1915)-N(3))-methyltransferase RlmH [Chitinophagaceae bacterium]
MKLSIWAVGKNHEPYVKEGVEEFTKRISNYFSIEWNIISLPKTLGLLSLSDSKKKEANIVLQKLKQDDFLVTLDENGKQFNSEGIASFLQQRANESTKQVVFLIGGAYGLDDELL